MNIRSALFRFSQATVILMLLGWIAVVYTATFLKGGHPPLSAIVGAAVIFASRVLGSVGLFSALASLNETSRRNVTILFACLNAGLLAFSLFVYIS